VNEAAEAMTKLRILLADDHEAVREGLKTILNAQPDMEVVGEAPDGSAALTQSLDLRPDVVVMDVSMPKMNGLKATEALHQRCPQLKILTLTRHAEQAYVQQLLGAGASGYILKQSRAAELLHAIRAVAAGGTYLDPSIAGAFVDEYGRRTQSTVTPEAPRGISPRETEILRLVAWGYSNKEIAAQLTLSVKTVETHKTNAMNKLGMHNRIDIVRFALLQGWLQDS
jgi:DNA-binding NarL/FixJ family response regulator